jgi:ATP-dependent 26S proteasome regulatory subunit
MDLISAYAVLFAAVIVSDLFVILLDRRIQSVVDNERLGFINRRSTLRGESGIGAIGSWMFFFLTIGLTYGIIRVVLPAIGMVANADYLVVAGIGLPITMIAFYLLVTVLYNGLSGNTGLLKRILFPFSCIGMFPPVAGGAISVSILVTGYALIQWVVSLTGFATLPNATTAGGMFLVSILGGFVGFTASRPTGAEPASSETTGREKISDPELDSSEIGWQRSNAQPQQPKLAETTESEENSQKKVSHDRRQFQNLEYDWGWSGTQFSDIGGYYELKDALGDEIVTALRAAQRGDDRFDRFGIEPERGILFYGPPGTGKTLFARALAGELNLPFVELSPADVASRWINEGPERIRQLFAEAQQLGPCVIFVDEAEHLFGARSADARNTHAEDRKLTTEFLVNLTREDREAIVVAATNRPEDIDPAILRPGRLTSHYYVGVPDEEARHAIFQSKLTGVPSKVTTREFAELARQTEGFTGADLDDVVDEAKRSAARRDADAVTREDFPPADALEEVSRRLTSGAEEGVGELPDADEPSDVDRDGRDSIGYQ